VSGRTISFFLDRIGEQCAALAAAAERMRELDAFIRQHGTIGTDEDQGRVKRCYEQYESLQAECEGAKQVLEELVAESVREASADLAVSWGEPFVPTFAGADAPRRRNLF
jgi:hypothetical protein